MLKRVEGAVRGKMKVRIGERKLCVCRGWPKLLTQSYETCKTTICRCHFYICRGWPKADWGEELCTATGFVLTFTGIRKPI